jgi:hypothetical protein
MTPDDRDDDDMGAEDGTYTAGPEVHDTAPPPDPEPIAAGRARLAVSLAFAKVSQAVLELEGVAMACARALDATVEP